MAFDSNIISFTSKTDKVDLVSAAHINAVQNELVILETILGTGLKGDRANLSTRLNNALDADGSILSGTVYPSPSFPSQLFFKTDVNTAYIRNAANSAWIQVNLSSGSQWFTANGTFTAPAGVYHVVVSMVGGGASGGGGGSANGGGGGGGGACLMNHPYPVTPGNNYTVTVGAGGASAAANTIGNNGANTIFNSTLTCNGGSAGNQNGGAGGAGGTATSANTLTGAAGGAGGAGGGIKPVVATTAGGTGGAGGSGSGGGGGGGTLFGEGGTGGNNAVGSPPIANTGAGGGGGGQTSQASGAGGDGAIFIQW